MNNGLKLARWISQWFPIGSWRIQCALAFLFGGGARFNKKKTKGWKKINLGSSKNNLPGWINVDIRDISGIAVRADVIKLPFKTGSLDILRASHVLEHFYVEEIKEIIGEWVRVLKSGGVLMVSVPDFDGVIQRYARRKKTCLDFTRGNFDPWVLDQIYGAGFETKQQDFFKHRVIFNKCSLCAVIKNYGRLEIIGAWNFTRELPFTVGFTDDSCDCYSINILARKK